MASLVCLLFGHKKAPVVFATNRFYCPRCQLDLGTHFQPVTLRLASMPMTRVKREVPTRKARTPAR